MVLIEEDASNRGAPFGGCKCISKGRAGPPDSYADGVGHDERKEKAYVVKNAGLR